MDRSQSYLSRLPGKDSRQIARWLRQEISPGLPTDRQRELAEEAAQRFDDRAAASSSG